MTLHNCTPLLLLSHSPYLSSDYGAVSPTLSPPPPLCTVISLMESWFQAVVHHLPTRNAPEGSRHLQTNSPFSSCHSEILVILPCGFLRFKFNHPSCPRVCKKKFFALATRDFGYCESHIHLMSLFINWWGSILLKLKLKYALSWRLPIAQPRPVASTVAENEFYLPLPLSLFSFIIRGVVKVGMGTSLCVSFLHTHCSGLCMEGICWL